MRFQLVYVNVEASLISLNQGQHDLGRRHAAQAHTNQIKNAHIYAGSNGTNPQPQRHKIQKYRNTNNGHNKHKATAKNSTK